MRARAVLLGLSLCALTGGCDRSGSAPGDRGPDASGASGALPLVADTLRPLVITDTAGGDTDDPAIWYDTAAPERSLLLGTDKGDSTGAVWVYTLDGHVDRARSVTGLQRMNNVDVRQDVALGAERLDIAVATERLRQRIRVFRLPDMTPIDDGGIVVFGGDTTRAPMGVALYRRPSDGAVFAMVGGKSGPTDGTYLWQYRLTQDARGVVRGEVVRRFGRYSGTKEIEAIAVDDALGVVYYSDEGVGVRKYRADPADGDAELALFATTGVVDDHEGLAIAPRDSATGYLIMSDQQGQRIHVFPREGAGGDPNAHPVLAVIPVQAQETDGLEVVRRPLGPRLPEGVLVMMSNGGAFHLYDWRDVQRAIDGVRAR